MAGICIPSGWVCASPVAAMMKRQEAELEVKDVKICIGTEEDGQD